MIISKRTQLFGMGTGILLLVLSLSSFYMLSGASDANTYLVYALDATDSSGGWLDVRLTVKPGPQPFVDLYLRDPVQNGRQRIQNLRVSRAGRNLAHWQRIPGFQDVLRIWNGFQSGPIVIEYSIDPLWFEEPETPRGYLNEKFGFFPGSIVLYTPISLNDILKRDFSNPGIDAGYAEMSVQLPSGWQMVSPWGSLEAHTPAATLRNGYIVLGPFLIQDLLYDNTPLLIGVYTGLDPVIRDELSKQIPALFETMRVLAGFDPASQTCYWSLAVLPGQSIQGSASGIGSLVIEPDQTRIAQEMFSWWNGQTLTTTNDARWLTEGFTMYYAAKALWKAGVWTEAEFLTEMERAIKKISAGGQVLPIDLIKLSNRPSAQDTAQADTSVRYGGGVLAYHLDYQLARQGKSLDQLWDVLVIESNPISTEVFLRELEKLGGAELSSSCADILHGRKALELSSISEGRIP